MRKSTRFCIFLVCSLLFSTSLIYGQFVNNVVQFTDGDRDYNPRFPVFRNEIYTYEYEYFVFERRNTQSEIDIYIQKTGPDGPLEQPIKINDNTSRNTNPVIAYNNTFNNPGIEVPRYILVAWETNKNGSSDIYCKYLIPGSGWSNEFSLDSSGTDSKNVEIICRDSTNFAITYEKEGDIYFREFNVLTKELSSEINITSTDSVSCSHPKITVCGSYAFRDSVVLINYERNISSTNVPIYYKKNSNDVWSEAYVLTGIGVNKNLGFPSSGIGWSDIVTASFRRDTLNAINIHAVNLNLDSMYNDSVLLTDGQGNYTDFDGNRDIIIRGGFNLQVAGFIKDNVLWKKAVFFNNAPISGSPNYEVDVVTPLSFDTLNPTITLNHSINKILPNGGCRVYWFIFNRSENFMYESRIFGVKYENCIIGINPISSEIPNTFALKQNYPNPFNPTTKIRFGIPKQYGNVKLSVFNTVGQEVAVLVNEQLQPGIYEYDFNAVGYPSGVYYYRLQAGEFSETKRMVLVK